MGGHGGLLLLRHSLANALTGGSGDDFDGGDGRGQVDWSGGCYGGLLRVWAWLGQSELRWHQWYCEGHLVE
jgi:hypothetical protein